MKQLHASFDFGDPLWYHCQFIGNAGNINFCKQQAWNALITKFPEHVDKVPDGVEIYYFEPGGDEVMIFKK